MDVSPPIVPVPEAPSCSKQCTRIFLPVCGSDAKTYNNLCLLEIADCESKAAGGAGVTLASENAWGEWVGILHTVASMAEFSRGLAAAASGGTVGIGRVSPR